MDHMSVQVTNELKLGMASIMKACNQIVMTCKASMRAPSRTSPDLSCERHTVLQEFSPFLMEEAVLEAGGGR